MKRLTAIAFGVGLALASISLAQAQQTVTGPWKLTVGAYDAPCTLTLTPDASGTSGAVATGENCPTGLFAVAKWRSNGYGVELYSAGGELIASLRASGANYVGTRVADGRKLALSR